MISNKLELGWKLVYFCFWFVKKLCKYKGFTAETGVVWRNRQKVSNWRFSGSFSLVLVTVFVPVNRYFGWVLYNNYTAFSPGISYFKKVPKAVTKSPKSPKSEPSFLFMSYTRTQSVCERVLQVIGAKARVI